MRRARRRVEGVDSMAQANAGIRR